MSHRVIAGFAKGRRLKPVPGDSTRPIMDRVKEALFSILGADVLDTVWLDLFAGTGAVGIEALSRGAAFVQFIDLERDATDTIKANLAATKMTEKAKVRRADALALLRLQPDKPYDYIYIAPPQWKELWKQALMALESNPEWIPPGTSVIVQIAPSEEAEITLRHLELEDRRKYGNTVLLFYVAVKPSEDTEQAGELDT